MTLQDIITKTSISRKSLLKSIKNGELIAERKKAKWNIEKKNFMKWVSENKYRDAVVVEQSNSTIDITEEFHANDYWESDKEHRMPFAEIFAGAGGMSCGFTMAGYEPIISVEIDQDAINTYNHNFERFKSNIEPSRSVTSLKVKDEVVNKMIENNVQLLCGGFPCQGFSMTGPRDEMDERNALYLDLLYIAKKAKPNWIVLENVKGLLSMYDGRVKDSIINDFRKLGYKMEYRLLNSADYGVAQNRERVIFIGTLLDEEINFPLPTVTEHVTVRDAFRELNIGNEPNESINHVFPAHQARTVERISRLIPGDSLYATYSSSWRRLHWDRPSITIKENHGGVAIHPEHNRGLSARELAKLQSFPDNFIFQGKKNKQLKQIGNAVPPLLAKAIGVTIRRSLDA